MKRLSTPPGRAAGGRPSIKGRALAAGARRARLQYVGYNGREAGGGRSPRSGKMRQMRQMRPVRHYFLTPLELTT